MNSKERKQRRFERRRNKRIEKKEKTVESIGTAEDVFTYKDMFHCGEECCKGVLWKQSVQNFKRHIFSRTAVNRRKVLREKGYKPKKLSCFTINERGKTRNIEAPHIDDRQIQKTLTKKVLLPLYLPQLIYDNGASLKGKGLMFSQNQLDKAIKKHIKKYGYNGWIIIADFKGFFPNADRSYIKEKHNAIKDEKLRNILNTVTDSGTGNIGLSIGVEPSQIEMIAYPSSLDNLIACQMKLQGFGHYMDDYHILVPPGRNPKEILSAFIQKAKEYGIIVSKSKTKIIPFGKPFKFCKVKRVFYGIKIIKCGCRDSIKRARRKIKMFVKNRKILSVEDVYTSIQSTFAHIKRYNNHKRYLKICRLFYSLFKCSLCDFLKNGRKKQNGICLPQAI